jgi:hypothetical protein
MDGSIFTVVNDEGSDVIDSIVGGSVNFNKIWIGILGNGSAMVAFITGGIIIDFIGTIDGLSK